MNEHLTPQVPPSTAAEARCGTIPAGFVVRGEICVDDPEAWLQIIGEVHGVVRSAGKVTIEPGGLVSGSVLARSLFVAGRVRRVRAHDGVLVEGDLVLAGTARVEADAVYEALRSEKGAVLAGTMVPIGSQYFDELLKGGGLPFIKELRPGHPGRQPAVAAARPEQPAEAGASGTSHPAGSGVAGFSEAAALRELPVFADPGVGFSCEGDPPGEDLGQLDWRPSGG